MGHPIFVRVENALSLGLLEDPRVEDEGLRRVDLQFAGKFLPGPFSLGVVSPNPGN
jgi:hypothetical protein